MNHPQYPAAWLSDYWRNNPPSSSYCAYKHTTILDRLARWLARFA